MLWIKNEVAKAVETAVLNTASVCSHMANREMEDFSHSLYRHNVMMQSWQNHIVEQTTQFWTFWFPRH